MGTYTGKVNGIDAQATPGANPRCQAFVNKSDTEYIQVTSYNYELQSALQLACSLGVEVDVSFDDSTPENILSRVRVLDRP